MSSLSATIAIRRYVTDHPEVDAEAAVVSIGKLDADAAGNDFVSGLELHRALPSELVFGDPEADLRSTLSFLISEVHPWWAAAFPYGRERVRTFLQRDEAQCFRAAGLFEEPPHDEVILWWDELAQQVRAEINDNLLAQGREAERLSLLHEHERLKALGIAREPRWIAIEDNGAGYDILSFDPGSAEPTSRLIEVKSSTHDPPRILLTRSEWEAAERFAESYIFHIWALPAKVLIERSVAEMDQHIPKDQGSGLWSIVEITLT